VQITQAQLARVVCIISAPQIAFQIASMAVPSLRSHRKEFIYFDIEGSSIGGVECGRESPAAMIVSVALLSITYFLAYLPNRRNKKELKHLPEIVDEREAIECITWIFIRALVIAAPVTALAKSPENRAFRSVCIVLSATLPLCYYIAFDKLKSVGGSIFGRGSTTGLKATGEKDTEQVKRVVMMCEMFSNLGRAEESQNLVDETLATYQSGSKSIADVVTASTGDREHIAAGFTRGDLKGEMTMPLIVGCRS